MQAAPEHYSPLDIIKAFCCFSARPPSLHRVFRRLKISPVLGFLTAGFCLGPYGLGALVERGTLPAWVSHVTFDNLDEIAPAAEFGVVFLLFMIGLELEFRAAAASASAGFRIWRGAGFHFRTGTRRHRISFASFAGIGGNPGSRARDVIDGNRPCRSLPIANGSAHGRRAGRFSPSCYFRI